MHELSVCRGLLSQALAIAQQHQAQGITCITLRIGPLSGIEPSLLSSAFDTASVGTPAEGAALMIENSPLSIHCETCGRDGTVIPNRLRCPSCDSTATTLISGDELLLVDLGLHFDAQETDHV